jgi:beta-phosphoglucomutase-like phosphatase (HAD superfamily)
MWVRQGRGSVSVSENQPLHSARTAYDAVIFDMDGVVTDTASVHARAWKALFDEVLPRLSTTPVQPFDPDTDYRRYVDGRPREDGIRTFLASRGIELPDGLPGDPPDDSGTQPTIAEWN